MKTKMSFTFVMLSILFASVGHAQPDRVALEQALGQLDQAQRNIDQARGLIFNALQDNDGWHCTINYGKGYPGNGPTQEKAKDAGMQACIDDHNDAGVCRTFRNSTQYPPVCIEKD